MIDTKLGVIASLKETFVEQVRNEVELLKDDQIQSFILDTQANARVRKLDSFTKMVLDVFEDEQDFRNAQR